MGQAADVRAHNWFRMYAFEALIERKIVPPYRPVVRSALDTTNFEDYETDDIFAGGAYDHEANDWDRDF